MRVEMRDEVESKHEQPLPDIGRGFNNEHGLCILPNEQDKKEPHA